MRIRPRSAPCAAGLVCLAVGLGLSSGPATARSTDALSPALDASLENSVTTFDAKLTTQGVEPPTKRTVGGAMLLADGTVDTDDCTLCFTAECCEVTVASVNPNCCEQTVQSVGQDCCSATTETAECCTGLTIETVTCTLCTDPRCYVWTMAPTTCRPDLCPTQGGPPCQQVAACGSRGTSGDTPRPHGFAGLAALPAADERRELWNGTLTLLGII